LPVGERPHPHFGTSVIFITPIFGCSFTYNA
jgi:hypothetical protein